MKITKSSNNLIELIKEFEGFSAVPYICPAGVCTIAYGSTRYSDGRKVSMTDNRITVEAGVQLLKQTLTQYELAVDAYCRDDINQNQFDALVDFAYNCGNGNLKSSTLLKKVNANPNDPTIAAEFARWNKGGNKVLAGLTRRRAAEYKLYSKPC
jgi:lysozyme